MKAPERFRTQELRAKRVSGFGDLFGARALAGAKTCGIIASLMGVCVETAILHAFWWYGL